jgi:hypothetical protein
MPELTARRPKWSVIRFCWICISIYSETNVDHHDLQSTRRRCIPRKCRTQEASPNRRQRLCHRSTNNRFSSLVQRRDRSAVSPARLGTVELDNRPGAVSAACWRNSRSASSSQWITTVSARAWFRYPIIGPFKLEQVSLTPGELVLRFMAWAVHY